MPRKKKEEQHRPQNNFFAWLLLLLGVYFLFGNVFRIDFSDAWPLILILVGIGILWKQSQS